MDSIATATIAMSAVSLLVPYLRMAGEALAKKAGEEVGKNIISDAWGKAKKLYDTIKAKFATSKTATEALDDLASTPDDPDIQAVVRVQLKKLMQEDDEFAKRLTNLLREAAEANVDVVFNTNIHGDVKKLVQMGNVYGDVTI